jgi:hypothetical protein
MEIALNVFERDSREKKTEIKVKKVKEKEELE